VEEDVLSTIIRPDKTKSLIFKVFDDGTGLLAGSPGGAVGADLRLSGGGTAGLVAYTLFEPGQVAFRQFLGRDLFRGGFAAGILLVTFKSVSVWRSKLTSAVTSLVGTAQCAAAGAERPSASAREARFSIRAARSLSLTGHTIPVTNFFSP
jgi:hypothetical protein